MFLVIISAASGECPLAINMTFKVSTREDLRAGSDESLTFRRPEARLETAVAALPRTELWDPQELSIGSSSLSETGISFSGCMAEMKSTGDAALPGDFFWIGLDREEVLWGERERDLGRPGECLGDELAANSWKKMPACLETFYGIYLRIVLVTSMKWGLSSSEMSCCGPLWETGPLVMLIIARISMSWITVDTGWWLKPTTERDAPGCHWTMLVKLPGCLVGAHDVPGWQAWQHPYH